MKRILLTVLAVVTAFTLAAKSRIVEASLKSEILGVEKSYSVYLPDGYDDSGRDYPVLYLLHGAWGYHRDWHRKGNAQQIADEAITSGMALPMVIIMPDAAGEGDSFAGKNMGYFNREGWLYEDFFFKEFIPYVEKEFRITGDRAHRAISGLSMGGGGTAVYALFHPDMFSSACPMSGLLGHSPSLDSRSLKKDFTNSAWANQPVEIVAKLTPEQTAEVAKVRWLVDCGDDDYLLDGNIAFLQNMREKNIPLEFRMRNGAHNWEYWRTSLPTVLTFVSIGFAE